MSKKKTLKAGPRVSFKEDTTVFIIDNLKGTPPDKLSEDDEEETPKAGGGALGGEKDTLSKLADLINETKDENTQDMLIDMLKQQMPNGNDAEVYRYLMDHSKKSDDPDS